jgi:hypothetical protein
MLNNFLKHCHGINATPPPLPPPSHTIVVNKNIYVFYEKLRHLENK